MKCPNCEANVANTEKVCPNCGFDFSAPPVMQENGDDNKDAEQIDISETKEKNSKPKEHRLKSKTKVMLALIILLLIILFGTFIFVTINRSNGKRIYNNLSSKLGNTIAIAEKNASIELMKNSDYEFIPNIQYFDYIYECPDTVLINGTHIPEWIIFCLESENGALEQITYYDFSIMKINSNGTKKSEKIDIDTAISNRASLSEVENSLQLSPLITINKSDKTITQIYKYYYIDQKTRDEISYYINVEFDNNDKVISIEEQKDKAIEYIISNNIKDEATNDREPNSSNKDDSELDSNNDIADLENINSESESALD